MPLPNQARVALFYHLSELPSYQTIEPQQNSQSSLKENRKVDFEMVNYSARPRAQDAAAVPALDVKNATRYHESDAHPGPRKQAAAPDRRPSHQIISQHHIHKPGRRASPAKNRRKNPRISTTNLFKKKDKRSHRENEKTPELIEKFEDGLEDAREAINDNTNNSFQKVHSVFNQRLQDISHGDKDFFRVVSDRARLLTAPLLEERVETEVRRDGKPFHEIVEIGRQVDAFRKIIDKEEAKLADLWEQWDALQNEYIMLGAEVFGAEAFGEPGMEFKERGGYKREMEMLGLEHSAKLEEIDGEIENIGIGILSKMKTKEKQLDAAAKKEQAQLLQSIMES